MSERMKEIKRSIEKNRRRKKHAKEIFTFVSEFFALLIVLFGLYLMLILVSVL